MSRTTRKTGQRCQVIGRRLSASTFRGELEEGRCELQEGHGGVHTLGSCALDPYEQVELTDAQWRALNELYNGRRLVVPPATRRVLVSRGFVEIHGHPNMSTSAKITELGRKIFPLAIRRSAW